MLNVIFFAGIALYFIATLLEFAGVIFKKGLLKKLAWYVSIAGFAVVSAYIIARGIVAGRLPLSNQFEFACAFGWGIGLFHILLRLKIKQEWISTVALPAAFLILSYSALLPKDINELMPALRSAWFGLHIGAAVFSYSSFLVAGCLGVKYLVSAKKINDPEDEHLVQLDYLAYRLTAFGFLMLTVVILSGCIWAEQAWSAFWTWDPKETWALITWIIYAIYLHQRMRKGWRGKKMAVFAVVAIVCVLFTFIGVNMLLPGLHSYK